MLKVQVGLQIIYSGSWNSWRCKKAYINTSSIWPQVATTTVNDIFEDEARGDGALGGDAVLPEDVTEVARHTTDKTAWFKYLITSFHTLPFLGVFSFVLSE